MDLSIPVAWGVAILLCSLRLSALLLMSPIFEGFGVPPRIRLMFILAFSITLTGAVGVGKIALPATTADFFTAAGAELLRGAMLGLGVNCAFNAVAFGGKILDIQMGFGLGNVYDPITRSQSPLLASMLGIVAVMMFFVSGADRTFFRGFAVLLEALPLGAPVAIAQPDVLIAEFGKVFSLGLMLAAPVVFSLFFVELGFALLSRILPQLNVFMVITPAKIFIGLLFLKIVNICLGNMFLRIYKSIDAYWRLVA